MHKLLEIKDERNLTINAKKEPKKIYSYINKKNLIKDYVKALKNENGEITTNNQQMCNILNKYFNSVFTSENMETLPIVSSRSDISCSDPGFFENDIAKRLKDLNLNKSPG